jgi:hypothetical protein
MGMLVASCFSFAYVLTPIYIALCLFFWLWYRDLFSLYFSIPLVISAIVPPIKSPSLVNSTIFGYMKNYFDYEEIFEISDQELLNLLENFKVAGRSIILTGVPHGILSYGGMCAGANADPRFAKLVTAAAGAVLATPILKHIVGVFGLIDASANSLRKHLKKGGIEGSVVLYTGGIAELFQCSSSQEILFLKSRKGFVKLALREVHSNISFDASLLLRLS